MVSPRAASKPEPPVIVQLQAYFENWRERDLSGEDIRYMYLDCVGAENSLVLRPESK